MHITKKTGMLIGAAVFAVVFYVAYNKWKQKKAQA